MALPTSGNLTLNQIHIEAGGSSGTGCTMNDTDIRGLTAAASRTINSTLGTAIEIGDFYGASSLPTTQITTGYDTSYNYPTINWRFRGYEKNDFGSANPVLMDSRIFKGNEVKAIMVNGQVRTVDNSNQRLVFVKCSSRNSAGIPNHLNNTDSDAFVSVNINGTTFTRSSATFQDYSSYVPQEYYWRWTLSGGAVDDNTSAIAPFPAVGQIATVTFNYA